MDTNATIDNYVNSVAARLPRRLRNDVGLELRTLLGEQVESAAEDAGRAADGVMALEVLRRFGHPDEVASRYASRGFQLVEPGYVPLFIKLAGLCVAVQWAATLPLVFIARLSLADWALRWGFSAFTWVGFLLVYFALASGIQRRWPFDAETSSRPWKHWIFWLPFGDWRPIDYDARDRRAELGALPLGVIFTIFLSAPAWFLGHLLPSGSSAAWAEYDPAFRHWLLLPLIALMTVRLVFCAAAGFNSRWRPHLAGIRLALWICFVGLLYWVLFGWQIFTTPLVDLLFRVWLCVFVLVNTIQIGLWMRRAATQVRAPKNLS